MGIFEWIKNLIGDRLKENLEDIGDNLELILKNFGNIFISLFIMGLGFYVLVDHSLFSFIFYLLTVIWIIFFNTIVLIKKPKYFYFTLIIILVSEALRPILADSFNFAMKGELFMALIYIGVWIAIKIRMRQIREEN